MQRGPRRVTLLNDPLPNLEAKREALLAQLAEVDGHLSELSALCAKGGAGGAAAAPRAESRADALIHAKLVEKAEATATATDAIFAVLTRERRWMSAVELLAPAKEIKPDLDMTLLHSAIYRLVQPGKIAAKGTKGSKQYAIPELESEAAVA